MESPAIQTERHELRPFRGDDVGAVHAYASDPTVTRFTEWEPNTLAETEAFVQEAIEDLQDTPPKSISLAIEHRDSRRVIGTVGLHLAQSDRGTITVTSGH